MSFTGEGMRLFDFLRRPSGSRSLTARERALVHAMIEALPEEIQQVMREQVALINLVQRHAGSREVNMYHLRNGQPAPEEVPSVRGLPAEHRLARIRFRAGLEGPSRVDLFLVEGRLFSMEFDSTLKRDSKAEQIEVVSVDVFLQVPPRERVPAEPTRAQEPEWLKVIAATHANLRCRAPMEPQQLEEQLRTAPAGLPREYLQLLRYCDGLQVGEIEVFGVSQLRRIPLGKDWSRTFWAFAEKPAVAALGIVEGGHSGQLFRADYSDYSIRKTPLQFPEAVRVWATGEDLPTEVDIR